MEDEKQENYSRHNYEEGFSTKIYYRIAYIILFFYIIIVKARSKYERINILRSNL
jgi:hypothetical protein